MVKNILRNGIKISLLNPNPKKPGCINIRNKHTVNIDVTGLVPFASVLVQLDSDPLIEARPTHVKGATPDVFNAMVEFVLIEVLHDVGGKVFLHVGQEMGV